MISSTKLYSVYNAPMSFSSPTVLILGGTGYLGQFLYVGLSRAGFHVISKSSKDVDFPCSSQEEFNRAIVEGIQGPIDTVINCVAISQPAECAKDPTKARAVNVPTRLVNWLNMHKKRPLLIHLSTDQVYEGTKSYYVETDETFPVNEYGASKLEAEQLIRNEYPQRHVILRSSIIVGPEPPLKPVTRTLFLQFIHQQLSSSKHTTFFTDEYRCPVSVHDIVAVVLKCMERNQSFDEKGETFNMGSGQRLSRADMALAVCHACNFSPELVLQVSASSVNRGVKSPADISMNSTKLETFLGRSLTSFDELVRQTFGCGSLS